MSSGMAGRDMRAVVVAIAIVMTGACDRSTAPAEAPLPSVMPVADSARDTPATTTPSFTGRVWLRAGAGSAPGAMQVYLSNGTLISDSCFETYRLSSWRLEGEELVWSEDGGASGNHLRQTRHAIAFRPRSCGANNDWRRSVRGVAKRRACPSPSRCESRLSPSVRARGSRKAPASALAGAHAQHPSDRVSFPIQ